MENHIFSSWQSQVSKSSPHNNILYSVPVGLTCTSCLETVRLRRSLKLYFIGKIKSLCRRRKRIVAQAAFHPREVPVARSHIFLSDAPDG